MIMSRAPSGDGVGLGSDARVGADHVTTTGPLRRCGLRGRESRFRDRVSARASTLPGRAGRSGPALRYPRNASTALLSSARYQNSETLPSRKWQTNVSLESRVSSPRL